MRYVPVIIVTTVLAYTVIVSTLDHASDLAAGSVARLVAIDMNVSRKTGE
jgi:chromosome segregation ATPase